MSTAQTQESSIIKEEMGPETLKREHYFSKGSDNLLQCKKYIGRTLLKQYTKVWTVTDERLRNVKLHMKNHPRKLVYMLVCIMKALNGIPLQGQMAQER